MNDLPDRLADLTNRHLLRHRPVVQAVDGPWLTVDGRRLLSFAGNDYLGLSQHPALIEAVQQAAARYGVGATASPLVCGHSEAHESLERELAAFVGRPRALYFYAGFAANVGIVPALAGRGDTIVSDALNHACLIDGARLSGAEIRVTPHHDVGAVADALAASPGRRKLVIVDAVFSMDGDVAPLRELLALCERHDAWLLLDDAHGFGVLGPNGEGTPAHLQLPASPRVVHMATLGKAAGVAGAFVAGEEAVVEWLMQRSRSYMFATAAPAMVAEGVRAALRVMRDEPDRRARLQERIAQLRAGLHRLPWTLLPSDTAIQPLVIGRSEDALALSAALREDGLWVPAIRPPTVPEGTARLRISLSAAHAAEHVTRLVEALRRRGP